MTITAKFASVCPCCGERIQPGTTVEWQRGSAARHVACSAGAAARPVVRNARCPNPRDCGDPCCDGSCGY